MSRDPDCAADSIHRAENIQKTVMGKLENTEVQLKICYRQEAKYSGLCIFVS